MFGHCLHDPELSSHYWLSPFPLHVLFTFPMTSWSCPFHAFQLFLHVPDIFSVCPLHFPCMSRSFVASNFPTSPVVPIGFLVLCFPFIPPALPLLSFLSLACPLSSPLFPFHFPLLSCHVDISFPHFLALPCISPLLPNISRKKIQRFCNQDVQKHRVFPDFRQKKRQEPQTSKEPAGGIKPGTPVGGGGGGGAGGGAVCLFLTNLDRPQPFDSRPFCTIAILMIA